MGKKRKFIYTTPMLFQHRPGFLERRNLIIEPR
ncbi:MAG: hypothetical protein RL386_716, partial [Bacteroidota bacterium]